MSAYIPVDLQKQIRAKFDDCCAYCLTAEFLIATTFEFEHIRPISAGGKTNFENVCLACPSCNRYKSSRQTGFDLEQGREVALFHPQQQIWEEHFTWNEDYTEIIGITEIGRATISVLKMNRPELIRIRRMWVKMGEHPPKI